MSPCGRRCSSGSCWLFSSGFLTLHSLGCEHSGSPAIPLATICHLPASGQAPGVPFVVPPSLQSLQDWVPYEQQRVGPGPTGLPSPGAPAPTPLAAILVSVPTGPVQGSWYAQARTYLAPGPGS